MRHGESKGNADKSVNQYIPNHKVPLTEDGHRQAHEAGIQLKEYLKEDDSICFYTSPYLRTRQTMAGIMEEIEDLGLKQRVYEEPRMREQDFGNFQGTPEEMKEIWIERARYGHFFYRIPHGESAADVYDRCSSFNETLFRQFSRDDFPSVLVLVTHGIWARVFLQKWFRWSVEYFEALQNVPHCSWIVLEKESNDRYKLKTRLAKWCDLDSDEEEEKHIKEDFKREIKDCGIEDTDGSVTETVVTTLEKQAKKSRLIRKMFNFKGSQALADDECNSGDDAHDDDAVRTRPKLAA